MVGPRDKSLVVELKLRNLMAFDLKKWCKKALFFEQKWRKNGVFGPLFCPKWWPRLWASVMHSPHTRAKAGHYRSVLRSNAIKKLIEMRRHFDSKSWVLGQKVVNFVQIRVKPAFQVKRHQDLVKNTKFGAKSLKSPGVAQETRNPSGRYNTKSSCLTGIGPPQTPNLGFESLFH